MRGRESDRDEWRWWKAKRWGCRGGSRRQFRQEMEGSVTNERLGGTQSDRRERMRCEWMNMRRRWMDVRRRVDKDRSVGWRGWRDWMRRPLKEKHKMERDWRNGKNQWLRHGREDEERKRKDWKSDRREVCSKRNDAVKGMGQVPRRFPYFRLIPVEVSQNVKLTDSLCTSTSCLMDICWCTNAFPVSLHKSH